MTLQFVHTSGKNTTVQADATVFGAKPNTQLLLQALHVYRSNQRQGTAKTKTRSEVNRTKKKWFKQKGTGNARHGARTPNIFVGGGVSHGPTGMENWSATLSAAQRKKALVYALSTKAQDILISDELEKLPAKTQNAAKFFDTITPKMGHVLVVLHEPIVSLLRSTQNLERVLTTQAARLNIYETLLADKIVMTSKALEMITTRLKGIAKVEVKAEPKIVAKEAPAKVIKKTAKAGSKKA